MRHFQRLSPTIVAGVALGALSGVLLHFAFPPHRLGWLALVALVPMWVARHRLATTRAEAGLFVGTTWAVWLATLTPGLWPGSSWPWLLPPAGGALAFVVTAVLARHASRAGVNALWLEGAAGWTVLEWVRAQTPLGLAGSFALTQYRSPELLQLTALTGPWGLTFLIVACNAALAAWLIAPAGKRPWRTLTGLAAALAVVVWAGSLRLATPLVGDQLAIAVVQPGIPSPDEPAELAGEPAELRRALATEDYEASSRLYLQRLRTQSEAVARGGGADLYVWPEAVLQGDPRYFATLDYEVTLIARLTGAYLVVPFFSPHVGAQPHFNMLAVYDPMGTVVGEYRKQRQSYGAEYSAGPADQDPIPVSRGGRTFRLGTLICFDFDFVEPARAMVRKGAQLLIAPSDDAYPGIARWHFALLPLHAAQLGVAAVKADNAYGSIVADSLGRIVAETDTRRPASDNLRIPRLVVPRHAGTPYSRFGDWFIAVAAALWVAVRSRERRSA